MHHQHSVATRRVPNGLSPNHHADCAPCAGKSSREGLSGTLPEGVAKGRTFAIEVNGPDGEGSRQGIQPVSSLKTQITCTNDSVPMQVPNRQWVRSPFKPPGHEQNTPLPTWVVRQDSSHRHDWAEVSGSLCVHR